ncbi:hypothetical protein LTS08_006218 [Lithohypha guttulata]|uniref:Chromate ion transporter n=1 Tax=Lithohypha guttulata TaxID=1690604 RepID=A0AAN7YET7_9EURO|nr:hypothetical protein LTR05_006840 [Lithohypha guttulata]KAK5098840.1 hypothetical protein LTS08_006218 [Lithohypha guttulata]
MPLSQVWDVIREGQRTHTPTGKLTDRVIEVFRDIWYLGFTAFGGPPAHFQIFHKKFVEERNGRTPWISEQTYQELFALSQALPGPASTKFLFGIVLIHAGWITAIFAFLIWSLPGALGMFALSLGVNNISETLPDPAYAFLSGLNASTVGIIAVAAVGLAEKCIKDPLSRILVIFGACAGLCYSALWYYPVIIVIGGAVTVTWDMWLGRQVRLYQQRWSAKKRRAADDAAIAEHEAGRTVSSGSNSRLPENAASIELQEPAKAIHAKNDSAVVQRRQPDQGATQSSASAAEAAASRVPPESMQSQPSRPEAPIYGVSIRSGVIVFVLFVLSFIGIMVARSEVPGDLNNRPIQIFANMYLAGTIIFGGGPVVIPLLREYVVTPGWVSPRDFLIGLAIIQAFPGPNFNFAVYLGGLALVSAQQYGTVGATVFGAFLGYLGIFLPGMAFAYAIQGVWRKLRDRALFISLLRGINATAVGLVFTAVYRLWEVGYLTNASTSSDSAIQGGRVSGRSLADEPWFVVIAVLTYAGNKWFNIPAAIGIAAGGILGIAWWGATQR